MDINRFKHVRDRLVALYKMMTEYTYDVVAPHGSFLTLRDLKRAKTAPTILGVDFLAKPMDQQITIVKMATAIGINGDDCGLGFRYPSRDIVEIYEGIQEYIMLWLEVKRNFNWLHTASLEELSELEAVAKYIFSPYTEYKAREQAEAFGYNGTGEYTLADALRGVWIYGSSGTEEISFVSHIALYKEEMGLSSYSAPTRSESLEDLLKDYSFGSGISKIG